MIIDDDIPEAEIYTGTNAKTGEERKFRMIFEDLQRECLDSIASCSGPCGCVVEPDGECPDGWISKPRAAHVI